MASSYDHFVLTRFSVTFLDDQPTPDDAWLRYRLGFFLEATVASLMAQSDRNFRWLVFLDDRGPTWLHEEFDALAAEVPLEPVWLRGPWADAKVAEEVVRRSSAPYLITTRLDSDDALANGFVERLHAEFTSYGAEQDALFVNFTRGLQVDRSGAVYRFDYTANPFVSLIERRGDRPPLTVFARNSHPDVRTRAPVREVRDAPMWLQVVHDGNVANVIRGPRVDPRRLSDNFSIPLGYDDKTRGFRLWPGRVRQRARLLSLWVRVPYHLRDAFYGRWYRSRGTRTRPLDTRPARGVFGPP